MSLNSIRMQNQPNVSFGAKQRALYTLADREVVKLLELEKNLLFIKKFSKNIESL